MRTLLTIGLSIVTACGSEQPPPQVDTATDTTVAGTSSSARSGGIPREIYIDSVTVGNPVVVYGRARTFENTVQVRVRDAEGGLITEVFTTSAGEMGNHNPFVANAWLSRPPGAQIVVESFEYSAKDGSVRSLTADTVAFTVPNSSFILDFAGTDCTTTVTVRREAPRTVAVARLLAEMLVTGPDSSERATGAASMFPRGSRVNTVILRQGELTVDFNERLQNVGGSCAAQAIRSSVTKTLSRLPSVRDVIITAGGSQDLALQP
jgi:hypothetical protein